MSTQPQWSPVDDHTTDLLTLVADTNHPSSSFEWDEYVTAVCHVAARDGLVRPNELRPLLRGVVAPRRVGAFTNRAKSEGLLVDTGEWQVSDDAEGRNGGKPARIYRLATTAPGSAA